MLEIISSSISSSTSEDNAVDIAKSWFGINGEDQTAVASLTELGECVAGEALDAFYDHVLSYEPSAAYFVDQAHIDRVKAAQVRYFQDLVSAEIDQDYVDDRRRVGKVHERTGVTPTLYIGAYSHYLAKVGQTLKSQLPDQPGKVCEVMLSLIKLAHFDMAMALETFVEARENTIQARERELSELPTPVLQLREGLLLIPVVGSLDSNRARALTISLLEGIRDHRARAVVLDITGVAAVDSAVANHLIQTMNAARLMGATSVLTGLSAEVAQSLVKIGVTGEALNTAGDLQQGIVIAEKLLAE